MSEADVEESRKDKTGSKPNKDKKELLNTQKSKAESIEYCDMSSGGENDKPFNVNDVQNTSKKTEKEEKPKPPKSPVKQVVA